MLASLLARLFFRAITLNLLATLLLPTLPLTLVTFCLFKFYLQIPPIPPRPDFDEPRQKLAKLREGKFTESVQLNLLNLLPSPPLLLPSPFHLSGEESMTKEEYTKMKQELEA